VFSDEQLDAVLRTAADDRRRGVLWTAVLWLFIDTGLRLGELAEVAIERVDLEAGALAVVGKRWPRAHRADRRSSAVRGAPLLGRRRRPAARSTIP
jgi:site-specific recombinase XerC